jgi:L-fucose dehydrogenase
MDLELKDRVVLVTGGASGIGAANVRAVVSEGAAAVIADRSAQQEVAEAKVHVVVRDLTAAENCKNAVDPTLQHFGRLDALVNNAAARRHEA